VSADKRNDPPDLDGALIRARAAARRRGTPAARAARAASAARPQRGTVDEPQLSGPGAGDRDPRLIGALVDDVATEHGWDVDLAVGSLSGRWSDLVGAEVAAHCRPGRFDNGELVLVAESTAWATQLRLLAPTLIARIAAVLGPDLVRRVVVHGPAAPNWRHGPWRVAGRGPRDTYG
jgi:predicted nucleic acid-binding Zn ribbon protein